MNFKTLKEYNYSKFFKALCLILIVGVLLIDIIPSWFSIIYNFINGSIFADKVLINLADKIVKVHANLLTLGFLLTLFIILNKRITLINFSVVLFVSWFLSIYEFIDEKLHPLVMKTGLLSSFLRPGISELNPQYTRLILFLLSSIVLFTLVYRSKTRTIDRSFILLVNISMIITTFIFHLAIPMGVLKYAKEDRLNTYVENMIELPNEFFCKNKTCVFFSENFDEKKDKFIGQRDLSNQFINFMDYSKQFFSDKNNLEFPVYGSAGDFVGTNTTFHACVLKNKEFLCAFDSKAMKNYGLIAKTMFAFLVSIAHAVWIFGGLYLLSMHKNRSIKKLAYPQAKKD
jgi:hypothetical protein